MIDNSNNIFHWHRSEPTGNPLDNFIDIYRIAQCRYKAFRLRKDVIGAEGYDYSGDFSLLVNKPGIYMLYNVAPTKISGTKINKKISVYIGKADIRSNNRGILSRLIEHVKNDSAEASNWEYAVCIVSDTYGTELFTPDVTKALESWFIQLFKEVKLENDSNDESNIQFEILNSKRESDGGSVSPDVDTHFKAILELIYSPGILTLKEKSKIEVDALKAKLEANRITIENIKKSVENYKIEKGLENYSNEFLEDALIYKLVSDAFYDSAKRFMETDVYTDGKRIYSLHEIVNCLKSQTVLTPYKIQIDMVNLLPSSIFEGNQKFLLLYSKDFVFGKALIERYLSLKESGDSKSEKAKNLADFVRDRLYVLVPQQSCYMENCKEFYNYYINKMVQLDIAWSGDCTNLVQPNITLVYNYDNIVKNNSTAKAKEKILELIGGTQELKFDVVVGNPPYNRGMDIDFVDMGFEMSKAYTVMITPAKWQTAEGNQKIASRMSYGDFRKKIVPHMREVVYYLNSTDIFDNVYQIDGITYYILDKKEHTECKVTNVQDVIYKGNDKINRIMAKYEGYDYTCRETVYRDIRRGQSLFNIGQEIIDSIGDYKSLKPDSYKGLDGKYKVWINNLTPGNQQVSAGGFLAIGKYYISEIRPDINQIGCYYSSDILDECKSYISYISSKFVRIFLSSNFSKLTGYICNNCFRFVPAPMVLDEQGNRVPGKFDHIYTDEELYKTWNLPQKYIDVIESVIKERR